MKGYWLSRTDGIFATGRSPYLFEKLSRSLPRRGTNGHTRQFFVPENECTEEYKAKNIPCQEQLNSDVLDELVANVSFTDQTVDDDSLSKQLKQARLQKIKTDTKLINQKLDQRKKLLFAEWSQKFFDQFANHFGRLKNCLVNMHLSKEQVDIFNDCLQNCLNNLQISLDQIWNNFNEQEQEKTE